MMVWYAGPIGPSAAFTNLYPDFLLAEAGAYEAKGYGGVLTAGFWGAEWDYDPVTSFSDWCEQPRQSRAGRAAPTGAVEEKEEL